MAGSYGRATSTDLVAGSSSAYARRQLRHLEANQANGATYDVDWVDIADPNPTFPYTRGQPAPTSNDSAISYVGD